MRSPASTSRDRAARLSLVAGAVWVAVLVVEGPPGSGYGWGSVLVSAGIVAGLFVLMAHSVRHDSVGRAVASAATAVLVVALVVASLVGNWAGGSTVSRVLDTLAAVLTVAAGGLVVAVAVGTVRRSRPWAPRPPR